MNGHENVILAEVKTESNGSLKDENEDLLLLDPSDAKEKKGNTGEKERELTKRRLDLYGQYLGDVQRAFMVTKNACKMTTMRKVQVKVCEIFKLKTDRAAWRTKVGLYGWFCMHWTKIEHKVPVVIRMVENEEELAEKPKVFPRGLLFVNLPAPLRNYLNN